MSSMDEAFHIPYVAYVGLTYSCNCYCTHCYARGRHNPNRQFLKQTDYYHLLKQLAGMGTMSVTYSHGETLLYPGCYEVFQYANQLGLSQVLITNGILLNNVTIARLKECGIQTLLISMDSIRETDHDANRGIPGCFKAVLSAVKASQSISGLSKGLAVTVAQRNLDQIEEIIQFALEQHLDFISLLSERQNGDLAPFDVKLLISTIKAYRKKIDIVTHDYRLNHFIDLLNFDKRVDRELFKANNDCRNCLSQLSIDMYGDVRSCNFLDKVYGNYFQAGLKDIWEQMTSKVGIQSMCTECREI